VSSVLQDPDESFERALFARRARASGGQAGVPSLDAVLRASGARTEAGERSSGRRRAWGGLALAAACLLAVMKTRPGDSSHGSRPGIIADVGTQSLAPGDRGAAVCEDPPLTRAGECALDTSCASMAATAPPVVADDPTCTGAPRNFTSATTLECDPDDVIRTEIR
jgi:hypothetical protein